MSQPSWNAFFKQNKRLLDRALEFYDNEAILTPVYPPRNELFSAFDLCPLENVKVCLVGQDPYHQQGQAHGLAFSVKPGCKMPPSLRNIYKEIGVNPPPKISSDQYGFLESWAKQGVFLLNRSLSVADSRPASHSKCGWQQLTENAISYISANTKGVVFLLWGNHAKGLAKLIDTEAHYILEAAHPSGLSAHRGFFGCNHFQLCNSILKQNGEQPINWV